MHAFFHHIFVLYTNYYVSDQIPTSFSFATVIQHDKMDDECVFCLSYVWIE